jgi:4-hydroxy-2-oxoheptanedioate aldolase
VHVDWMLKQVPDPQTVVVPMVNTAQQAAQVAAAVRHPPKYQWTTGHVGAALARQMVRLSIASFRHEQIFPFVQIESASGYERRCYIAATPRNCWPRRPGVRIRRDLSVKWMRQTPMV